MATKEKAEKDVAIEAVKEADKKVDDIKAERAAKRAVRFAKRENWWGPFKYAGKLFNVVEEHPVASATCALTGGAAAVALVIGKDHFFGKKEEDVTEESTEEVVEAPFDTEA